MRPAIRYAILVAVVKRFNKQDAFYLPAAKAPAGLKLLIFSFSCSLLNSNRHKAGKKEYIRNNREYFSRIPRSAVDVINVCTNIKNMEEYLNFTKGQEDGEETADMCRALVEIEKDAEKRGVKKGVRKGVQQGINRIRRLTQLLLADGRQDDLVRSATDNVFIKKLFTEYGV